jgi:hypothetical protein
MAVMVKTRRTRLKQGCMAGQKRARLSKVKQQFLFY